MQQIGMMLGISMGLILLSMQLSCTGYSGIILQAKPSITAEILVI